MKKMYTLNVMESDVVSNRVAVLRNEKEKNDVMAKLMNLGFRINRNDLKNECVNLDSWDIMTQDSDDVVGYILQLQHPEDAYITALRFRDRAKRLSK